MEAPPHSFQEDHVLALVAFALDSELTHRATTALLEQGACPGTPTWLGDGTAWEVPFTGLAAISAEAAVRHALGSAAVDLAVQDTDGRRKRLLVADMESTIIQNEMLDELADFVGCRAQVETITARAMNGELDFRAALEERVGLLAGLAVEVLEQALERLELMPGAATLIATLRAHGVKTALVSGGFTFFAERVARQLGFDFHDANELEIADGRLTGRVVEPVRDRQAKLATLDRLCAEPGLERAQCAAVGDGSNDLAMLEAAGLGVAYHAKPSVARAARYRVEHGDLTTLLYYQGYRYGDFHVVC